MNALAAASDNCEPSYCLPLDVANATLSRVGGKGLNLAKLARAGFPVPGGFIVTVSGYDAFVDAAGLSGWMATEVAAVDTVDPAALAALSARARDRFRRFDIPSALATASRWQPLAGWLARWLAFRVRALAGLRESPKFVIIRLMGLLREALLQSGQERKDAGVLERADDIFYLHIRELKTLALHAPGDWNRLVRQRRANYQAEQRRRAVPRILLSDGTAIFAGLSGQVADDKDADGKGALVGSGVSPGVVDGVVRVLFDPVSSSLQPGEILVCPGTDPSWTPLFLAAAGLVMEVGGMMTHGSVVAREYGIPAVVGLDQATRRLKTGQRIRVDGGSGRIEFLD